MFIVVVLFAGLNASGRVGSFRGLGFKFCCFVLFSGCGRFAGLYLLTDCVGLFACLFWCYVVLCCSVLYCDYFVVLRFVD